MSGGNVFHFSNLGAGLNVYNDEKPRAEAVEAIAYDLGLPLYIESLNDFRNKLDPKSLLVKNLVTPKIVALQNLIGYDLDEVNITLFNDASEELKRTLNKYNEKGLGRQGVRDRLTQAINHTRTFIIDEIRRIFTRLPTSPTADVQLVGTMGENLLTDQAQLKNMANAPNDPKWLHENEKKD